jgi:lipid-binding SYLF domain-containing protein
MRGLSIFLTLGMAGAAFCADTSQERLTESSRVFSEIMATPDKGIPQDLLNKAECVIVLPNLKKAAFVVGGEYGRGYAVCRKHSGTGWGAPEAVRLEGGSVGFQIGGSSTDVVMLVMNREGMNKLMQDKFTLGADASVAAGPVGRTADAKTNVKMDAEILGWSRAKGLFAGVALNGATMRPDNDENEKLYGKKVTPHDILMGSETPPPAAHALLADLNKYSASSSADRSKQ